MRRIEDPDAETMRRADDVRDVLSFHAEALRLRAHRQTLLGTNLANADTPHYKAVDFRFADALAAATRGNAQVVTTMHRTDPAHLQPVAAGSLPGVPVLYRAPAQGAVDGNTVDADAERAQFADNTVRYEAALRFLNHHLKAMLSAAQG
jgi:flagellar basal-body rod protein FlgB